MNETLRKFNSKKEYISVFNEQQKLVFGEALKRSRQLDTILTLLKKEDKRFNNYVLKNNPHLKGIKGKKITDIPMSEIINEFNRMNEKGEYQKRFIQHSEIMEIYSESYYLFAHRLIDLLVQISIFKNIKKKKSKISYKIFRITNALIKHAENPNLEGTMEQSFSSGAPEGPKVKGDKLGNEISRRVFDQGVYKTHNELIQEIEKTITPIN